MSQQSRVEGKLLPEIVRIVGTYTDSEGTPILTPEGEEQWKILRYGEYDPRRWQPWPKSKIMFMCGKEGDAFKQVIEEPTPRN